MLDDKFYQNKNIDFKNFYSKSKFKFSTGLANGDEIEEFIDAGHLTNANIKNINAVSIDLNLNDDFKTFRESRIIDITKKETPEIVQMRKDIYGKYSIFPGMFFLASTQGVFQLPNWLTCKVELRSSSGRIAMNHMNSGLVDPGFNNANITLEFLNQSPHMYLINSECCFVQVCFYKNYPVSEKYNYKNNGRYNGIFGTVESKSI